MNLKTYFGNLSRKLYLRKLPRKRMGAGCLLFDSQQRILILKPTYRDCWLLPGGVIENNESPKQACIREVKEETGIICNSVRLLCVDYVYDRETNLESIQFVFLGGMVNNLSEIDIPRREINTYQFCETERAIKMLGIHSQRRLQSCISHLNSSKILYLENGFEV